MLKSIEEFKQFIQWAKDAGLEEAKIGDFSFKLSSYEQARKVIAEEEMRTSVEHAEVFSNPRAQSIKENSQDISDDDDLFYSAT